MDASEMSNLQKIAGMVVSFVLIGLLVNAVVSCFVTTDKGLVSDDERSES